MDPSTGTESFSSPAHFTTGGTVPPLGGGGFIRFVEPDSADSGRFVETTEFTGDASQNYGGQFTFAMRTNVASVSGVTIALRGEDGCVFANPGDIGAGGWVSFSVPIQPGWIDCNDDTLATKSDFEAVLRNLGGVIITADNHPTADETVDLDNVALTEGEGLGPDQAARNLTISYRRGAFRAKLSLVDPSDDPACIDNQLVKVFKQDAGPDTLIGSDRTSATGNYLVQRQRQNATYYAKAPRSTTTGGDVCLQARSPNLGPA